MRKRILVDLAAFVNGAEASDDLTLLCLKIAKEA